MILNIEPIVFGGRSVLPRYFVVKIWIKEGLKYEVEYGIPSTEIAAHPDSKSLGSDFRGLR